MPEDSYQQAAFDTPAPGVFDAIFRGLDQASRIFVGPADRRLLVIPIHDDAGGVAGGLWGATLFRWFYVQMLFVPEPLRGRGVGSAIMALAEREAQKRGCHGAYTETFSFQAAPFYERLGYNLFGELDGCPNGHHRLFLRKCWGASGKRASNPVTFPS